MPPPSTASTLESTADLNRTWDHRVDSWEAVARSAAFQRLAWEVFALADPQADDRVLDLGSGTGLLSLLFAPFVAEVIAVDSSLAMLERLSAKANASGAENVVTIAADLRSLPLPDESTTLAVSNYAFHHLDDRGKELALSEVRRVLVPGGRLVICDMMFALSPRPRNVAVIGSKLALLARRGPAGLLRIARNGVRILTRRWEHPAPPNTWERMLTDRHFENVRVSVLEHEAGILIAGRPTRTHRL